ncbi:hypothetical protein [Cumulibacter soli]|uniref:hypothetical protein n=1 Tax=Cumulibacter soli TaxID=2546344 RepID=UPI00106830DF|nr:hypothetical protein [Cumulibacter soli]
MSAYTRVRPTASRSSWCDASDAVGDTEAAAHGWERLADLLDVLVDEYEHHLGTDADAIAAQAALTDVLDGFDVVSASARRNAEVLDDLAVDLTLAHARMAAIGRESENLNEPTASRHSMARADREVQHPLDGSIGEARDRLRIAG